MRKSRGIVLASALALCACASPLPSDQRPMYGGEDRGADPAVRAADEKLVADATRAFKDKRSASNALCSDGDAAIRAGDLSQAMRLYNQAWLVDRDNPSVYWGFAGVLDGRNEFCESTRMLDAGAARGRIPPKVVPSAALVYAGCGITLAKVSEADSGAAQRYYAKAEALLQQAEADPDVPRKSVVEAWARYYYLRGDYTAAWQKVAEYQKTFGSEMNPGFVALLRQRQPTPIAAPEK